MKIDFERILKDPILKDKGSLPGSANNTKGLPGLIHNAHKFKVR